MMQSMENGKKQLLFQLINLEQVGFIDLDEEVKELMLATTDKWLEGEDVPEDAILANFVKYHRMVRDFDKRMQMESSLSFLCSRIPKIWRALQILPANWQSLN